MSEVVIVSAVYPPEPLVSATMGRDLAVHLVEKGLSATVLCPQPSRPTSADYSHLMNSFKPVVTFEDDIEVVRLPSFTAPHSGVLSRARESYSFGRHACRYLKKQQEHPGVIYVNAWPLLSQSLVARYARSYKIPMVLQIMDIYPESLLIKLPPIFRKIVETPLQKLDRWTARNAEKIVVISDNMSETYLHHRKIPQEKVVTINIWQDEGLFEQLPSSQAGCNHYGVPHNRFTFLYLGNIGPVAGVDYLIRTFHYAAIENTQLLIVGDGSVKSRLEEMVTRLRIDHVRFISDPETNNVPLIQSMANVCLLPLKRGAGMSSIPSKLAAYMFSAKPVLAAVDENSDTAHAILKAKGGWVSEPENIEKLAAKMKEIVSLSNLELEKIGQNGREYGFRNFNKSRGVSRLAEIILAAGIF